jgi:thiol:disulfide interchange protein DsbD
MRIRFWISCLMLLATSAQVLAQITPEDLLPVEEAFALEGRAVPGAVELDFDIADGYYLYRHAFRFESLSAGISLGAPEIPDGEVGFDDFFGEIESYRDRLRITLPIRSGRGEAEIAVRFQGCADLGVCYPPHRQIITLPVAAP